MRDLREAGTEDHLAEERRAHHAERVLADRQWVCISARSCESDPVISPEKQRGRYK